MAPNFLGLLPAVSYIILTFISPSRLLISLSSSTSCSKIENFEEPCQTIFLQELDFIKMTSDALLYYNQFYEGIVWFCLLEGEAGNFSSFKTDESGFFSSLGGDGLSDPSDSISI